MQKRIHSGGYINNKSRSHQNNQSRHGVHGGLVPARQLPEADLNDVDHGQHEEEAAHDGAQGGAQHPEPQNPKVDVGPEGLVGVLAVEEIDGELEALGDEGGEEEETEGDDLEDEELLGGVEAGVAGGGILKAVLARGGQGEAHEDGDREEGVHVHQAVQGGHVDTGG